MASKQVLKLCEKIEKDCDIICKPETFHTIRNSYSFNVWEMDIDVEKSTRLIRGVFGEEIRISYKNAKCASFYYIKDLLKCNKLTEQIDVDSSELLLYPEGNKYEELKISDNTYVYRGYTISKQSAQWEAVNIDTGCIEHTATTKKLLYKLIDKALE